MVSEAVSDHLGAVGGGDVETVGLSFGWAEDARLETDDGADGG